MFWECDATVPKYFPKIYTMLIGVVSCLFQWVTLIIMISVIFPKKIAKPLKSRLTCPYYLNYHELMSKVLLGVFKLLLTCACAQTHFCVLAHPVKSISCTQSCIHSCYLRQLIDNNYNYTIIKGKIPTCVDKRWEKKKNVSVLLKGHFAGMYLVLLSVYKEESSIFFLTGEVFPNLTMPLLIAYSPQNTKLAVIWSHEMPQL